MVENHQRFWEVEKLAKKYLDEDYQKIWIWKLSNNWYGRPPLDMHSCHTHSNNNYISYIGQVDYKTVVDSFRTQHCRSLVDADYAVIKGAIILIAYS